MHTAMPSLRAMWITMRPYLLFVSGITGVAGMALAPPEDPLPLFVLFAASFFAYGFGQALTDCFQTDTDALSAPYRPLVAGRVSRRSILTMSVAGLIACVAVFASRTPWNLLLGGIAAAGLASYTPFKRRWWGGPWYNAWIVAVLCVMAFLGARGNRTFPLPEPLVPVLATVFFGYANFVLSGYFKDVDADARTGYRTFPVTYGRKAAAVASDFIALLFTGSSLMAAYAVMRESVPPNALLCGLLFAIPGFVFVIDAQVRLHKNRTDRDAYAPILRVVHAYILILSGVAALLRPEWTPFLAAHYLLFVYVVSTRPEVSQI